MCVCVCVLGSSGYSHFSEPESEGESETVWGGFEEEYRWTDSCELPNLQSFKKLNTHLSMKIVKLYEHIFFINIRNVNRTYSVILRKLSYMPLLLSVSSLFCSHIMSVTGCFSSIPAHWARSEELERGCRNEESTDTPAGEEDLWPGESGRLI